MFFFFLLSLVFFNSGKRDGFPAMLWSMFLVLCSRKERKDEALRWFLWNASYTMNTAPVCGRALCCVGSAACSSCCSVSGKLQCLRSVFEVTSWLDTKQVVKMVQRGTERWVWRPWKQANSPSCMGTIVLSERAAGPLVHPSRSGGMMFFWEAFVVAGVDISWRTGIALQGKILSVTITPIC